MLPVVHRHEGGNPGVLRNVERLETAQNQHRVEARTHDQAVVLVVPGRLVAGHVGDVLRGAQAQRVEPALGHGSLHQLVAAQVLLQAEAEACMGDHLEVGAAAEALRHRLERRLCGDIGDRSDAFRGFRRHVVGVLSVGDGGGGGRHSTGSGRCPGSRRAKGRKGVRTLRKAAAHRTGGGAGARMGHGTFSRSAAVIALRSSPEVWAGSARPARRYQ